MPAAVLVEEWVPALELVPIQELAEVPVLAPVSVLAAAQVKVSDQGLSAFLGQDCFLVSPPVRMDSIFFPPGFSLHAEHLPALSTYLQLPQQPSMLPSGSFLLLSSSL
jgi:hypothetical protein